MIVPVWPAPGLRRAGATRQAAGRRCRTVLRRLRAGQNLLLRSVRHHAAAAQALAQSVAGVGRFARPVSRGGSERAAGRLRRGAAAAAEQWHDTRGRADRVSRSHRGTGPGRWGNAARGPCADWRRTRTGGRDRGRRRLLPTAPRQGHVGCPPHPGGQCPYLRSERGVGTKLGRLSLGGAPAGGSRPGAGSRAGSCGTARVVDNLYQSRGLPPSDQQLLRMGRLWRVPGGGPRFRVRLEARKHRRSSRARRPDCGHRSLRLSPSSACSPPRSVPSPPSRPAAPTARPSTRPWTTSSACSPEPRQSPCPVAASGSESPDPAGDRDGAHLRLGLGENSRSLRPARTRRRLRWRAVGLCSGAGAMARPTG